MQHFGNFIWRRLIKLIHSVPVKLTQESFFFTTEHLVVIKQLIPVNRNSFFDGATFHSKLLVVNLIVERIHSSTRSDRWNDTIQMLMIEITNLL